MPILLLAATLVACNNKTTEEKPVDTQSEIKVEKVKSGNENELKKEAVSAIDSQNVLYLVNDEKVSKAQVEAIDPETIKKVDVYKDKEKLKEYGANSYDGMVVVTLK